MRQVLGKGPAQRLLVKACDQPFAGSSQRPLDYPRFLCHQLDRLLGAKLPGSRPVALNAGLFGLRNSRES